MKSRYIILLMTALLSLFAVAGYTVGIFSVIYKCNLEGKYQRDGVTLMCIVKDTALVGTKVSWNS